MQANERDARYVNEQILRRINANPDRVRRGQIKHPLGALDPTVQGPDADNEHVEVVIDRDVRARPAFAFGAGAVAFPDKDDDISRYSRRRVPPYERRRVLRLNGMEPLPGGGVGGQQLEFLHRGHATAGLVAHSIRSQHEFVAQVRTSHYHVSERAACLTRQVGDGVWSCK